MLQRLVGLLGLVVLLGIAFALSANRRRISLRVVLWGLGLQVAFAMVILRTAPGRLVFEWLASAFKQLIAFTDAGSTFVFGNWRAPLQATNALTGQPHRIGYALAFTMLPVIIFFSSLMSILYHLGIMQRVVAAMAWLMRRTMRVSGAEALNAAGNIFVGMTEAPLTIRPYVADLTDSELMAVMVGGLATIAGSVMALYVGFGIEAGHLLCASVMSAPAALMVAKIMLPETSEPKTSGTTRVHFQRETQNVIDAASAGAWQGLRLALNVGAMLIAFIALLAMINYWLRGLHDACVLLFRWSAFPASLEEIFGFVFRPLAWAMGVPWAEADEVGSLMGVKVSANELIAYTKLAQIKASLSPRSLVIATYALCGFGNFGSIAILIGGIGSIAPQRRPDLSRLALRALAGAVIASFTTATIAGILL